MQNELKDVKETYVTHAQLSELRMEMFKMQNDSLVPSSVCKVNMKRGAWLMDSGPIGLSHAINSSTDEGNSNTEETGKAMTVDGESTLPVLIRILKESSKRPCEKYLFSLPSCTKILPKKT